MPTQRPPPLPQAKQLDALFDRRKQQFSALAGCIEEVHATIEAESPEEGALPGEAGEVPAAAAAAVTAGAQQVQQPGAGEGLPPPAPAGGQRGGGLREGQRGKGGPSPMQLG